MLPETITAHSDPYFVNRVTEFSRFRQLLNSSSNLATIILHGPAGIGKTSLLKEFGALCMQEKITYVYVDLDHYEFDRSPNYLAIVFNLWYQLGIDEIQSLHDLIFQGIVPTFLGASSPKSNSSGNTSLNMGDIVDVEGKNQFAFGNNNTLIEKLLIQIGTNEEIQVLIRTQLTQAFQKHLQKLIENQPIIFLLDSWDKMVTEQGKPKEIGEWLQKELLDWSRFHNLKNLKSVISCKQERGLDDIRKQAHIVPLDPLSAPDVQRYFTARLGNQYTNQEVQSLTNLAQGIPSVMSFMAIGIEQHGNSEILNRSNKFRSDNLSETVRFAIEGFLQRLPCNFMGLPKIAAIPRRFNRELLAQLYDSTSDIDEFIEYIMVYPVASSENSGPLCFSLRQEIRDYLLDKWQHTHGATNADYTELNRQAYSYFVQQATQMLPESLTGYEYKREALYHLYIVDPAAAIEEWAEQFEYAYRNYAVGHAESYLDLAHELKRRNLWAEKDNQWLDYFNARLDFFYRRNDYGVETLLQIKNTTVNKTLQALSAWALGNVRLSQKYWSEALVLYHQSLERLGYSNHPQLKARFMLAIGNAYHDLATQRDVVFKDIARPSDFMVQIIHKVQKAPYILYNQLVRHISWLPNWYFGTNYSDWFVAHFLIEAADWYRKAEAQLDKERSLLNYVNKSDDPHATLRWDIQMLLANVEHRLGRWQQARKRYGDLIESYTDSEYIHSYHLAQIRLGHGKALIQEGLFEDAHIELSKALADFQKIQSKDSIGHTAVSLGHIERLENRLDEAVKYYLLAIEAFKATKNDVAITQILSIVERLEHPESISDSLNQQLHTTIVQFHHRHYITHFPDTLIWQFRRLAIWIALPTTYIAAFIVAFVTTLFLLSLESLDLLIQHFNDLDILILIASTLLSIPFAIWFFHFIYSLLGSFFVHWVGSHLVILERQQPNHITLDDTGISYLDTSKKIEQTFRWTEIAKVLSIEYLQAQRLLKLITRIAIESKSGEIIVIDSVISNYSHLKKEIKRHLEQVQNYSAFTEKWLEFFDAYWILGILAATALVIGVRIEDIGATIIPEGHNESSIKRLAPFLVQTFIIIGIFYPTVTLYRLIHNRFTASRIFPRIRHTVPSWVLYCLTLLLTIFTIGYAYVFLTVQPPVKNLGGGLRPLHYPGW